MTAQDKALASLMGVGVLLFLVAFAILGACGCVLAVNYTARQVFAPMHADTGKPVSGPEGK